MAEVMEQPQSVIEGLVTATVTTPGILTITLNRPDQFNALSRDLMRALQRALEDADHRPEVRVVVLAGAGKAFCAGHDLKELRAQPDESAIRETFAACGKLMLTITRISKPVIARVHGIATAAGCQLVATCDLAVAATEARFAVSGVNLGLFCATPMVALTRNMPRKIAMELLMTGRFIDAATALRYGLVNRVVAREDLDSVVLDLATVIAAKSPAAISFGKRAFYRQVEMSQEEAYALACEVMTCNMMAEDAAAGIDAFIEKRPPPAWVGR